MTPFVTSLYSPRGAGNLVFADRAEIDYDIQMINLRRNNNNSTRKWYDRMKLKYFHKLGRLVVGRYSRVVSVKVNFRHTGEGNSRDKGAR